jgi:hypothetical protein
VKEGSAHRACRLPLYGPNEVLGQEEGVFSTPLYIKYSKL